MMCLVGNSADLERYKASGCTWLVIVHILKGIRHRDVVGKSADLEKDTASGCAWMVIVYILKGIRYPDVVGW